MDNEEVKETPTNENVDDSTTTEETKTEKYLVIFSDNTFGFNDEEFDGATNIVITQEDYHKFFDLQAQGKQFRLKDKSTGSNLFDYIEEYTPASSVPDTPVNNKDELKECKEVIYSLQELVLTQQMKILELQYQ